MMRTILFTISLLTFGFAFADGTFEDSKQIRKAVAASSDFELDIVNKHGRIDVMTWDKDSVVVEVLISVSSNKLERVEDIMNQVDVHFSESSDYLSAGTVWGSGANELRIDAIKLFDEQTIRVDYKVWMPEDTELEIENKFGDITLESCKGKVKIDLAHGDFKAQKLKKAKSIKVQYGDVHIKEVKEANIISKFGDVNIDEVDELDLDIVSGDAELEIVNELNLNATSADVEIEEVNTLNFTSSLGDIEVEKLNKTCTGYLKFGGLDIEEVTTSFMGITLNGTNTDISLDFNPQIAFVYNVQLEKGKAFSIPSTGNTLDKDNSFNDVHQYEGIFATIPIGGLPASVNISVKSSYVKLGLD